MKSEPADDDRLSHRDASMFFVALWMPLAALWAFATTTCSQSPLVTLGLSAVWVSVQVGGNVIAASILDEAFHEVPSSLKLLGRSFLACAGLLALGLPFLVLFPQTVSDCM